ncbi:MAG: RCC1 domain-containing protein [Candidatus Sericytochromatia bacterium]
MRRHLILRPMLVALSMVLVAGCQPGDANRPQTQQPAPVLDADLSAGGLHAVAVGPDGSVWAWGDNDSGELGLSGDDRAVPHKLTAPAGRAAAPSDLGSPTEPGAHTVVLGRDGKLYVTGDNSHGQLGLTGDDRLALAPIDGLEGVTAVTTGADFTVAVKADGTAWAWGRNSFGQLGDGSVADHESRVQVAGVKDFKAVSAGTHHVLGLRRDGGVVAWGDNHLGQLGDGTTENRDRPVTVRNLVGAVQVAAGGEHSAALKADGTVWTWGDNDYGTLGNPAFGRKAEVKEPVQVEGLTGVVAIASGEDHMLALKADGTVWAWGDNGLGQLGDGKAGFGTLVYTPVRVAGLENVAKIAAGNGYSLAAKADGTVWAWGANGAGQLGIGKTDFEPHALPLPVVGADGQGQLKLAN